MIELPEGLTARVMALPRDSRGFPIPWFVSPGADGEPNFQHITRSKVDDAVRRNVCWICGGRIGVYKSFVVGPMCTLTRVSAEPPSHLTCCEAAVQICPFLVNPRMKRAPAPVIGPGQAGNSGELNPRNPGVCAIYTTRKVTLKPVNPGYLFAIGAPVDIAWYREKRAATLDEVCHSIAEIMPALAAAAASEDKLALDQHLEEMKERAEAAPLSEAELGQQEQLYTFAQRDLLGALQETQKHFPRADPAEEEAVRADLRRQLLTPSAPPARTPEGATP